MLLVYVDRRLLRTKFLPLFVQRRWLKSRYPVRTAHEIFKVRFQKRKIPPTQRSDDFVGVNRRQNESGVLRGGTFFLGNHPLKVVVITARTTTFVSRIWNKGYHGSVGASIWFCKFYCGKAVEVGLIKETPTIVQQGKKTVLDRGLVWGGLYGRCPMPPSSVKVSPDMNLKSGLASWTQTRPISVSAFP